VPRTRVILFKEADGTVPLLNWMDELPDRVRDKCVVRLRRLAELGHELRRPEADFLRNGVYELRVGFQGINYRMLFFFHGNLAAVLSHGIVKERTVPPVEIDRAIGRMRQFVANPHKHTMEIAP
jgi:phage-related protein